uniref:Retroviral polymerase SH3-like domain-containing protein n=1 Tax=Tanacetum cinerariifolium TaxID=118510 RepID=A0A6L2N8P3_TANCI|nr:hypothetical protein [Tanacetum cinerariifolium]
MAFVVNSVLAYGVDLVLIKEFASFALQKLKIHSLMNQLRILTMILQTLSTHHHSPRHTLESVIPLIDITSQLPLSIVITTSPSVLATMEREDSLIMGNEELSTIPEKESNKVIKSSVEDLVPILIESKDTSGSDCECDLSLCDNFSAINVFEEKCVTFSNTVFNSSDDFTSSDDESLSDKDVPNNNFKIYSNPFFEFDDEYISSDVNPLFDEVLETSSDDVELLLHRDPSTPKMSVVSILEGFTDEPPLKEDDELFDLEPKNDEWKKILYDAPIDDLMIEDKVFNVRICEKKISPTYGIKREFSVPRTPQQNEIAERKNRTLIEAARTLVLVTKPHNKTPYELLHGRLPSIGFMRPFGCPVTILNTLDPLGNFQGKVDEGFLVGYSVCSKAFRVFNSRTRTVQETLHVNFMENKPNVAGSGSAWLFDIDSLTRTMNYLPVTAKNQTNTHADVLVDGKEHDDNIQKFVSLDIHSSSSGAQIRNQGHKTENKDKEKSIVVTITGFRDSNEEFEECINNSSNGVNVAGSSASAARLNFTNSTNDFSVAGPSNTAASPPIENSALQNVSTFSHDADMPNMENYTHSDDADDVGAETDINNLKSTISVSPIRTSRIHKDHPTSQIIGDLSLTTQNRSMAKAIKDQGGLSQMFNEDFHTCMFACFFSQKEPK